MIARRFPIREPVVSTGVPPPPPPHDAGSDATNVDAANSNSKTDGKADAGDDGTSTPSSTDAGDDRPR